MSISMAMAEAAFDAQVKLTTRLYAAFPGSRSRPRYCQGVSHVLACARFEGWALLLLAVYYS